MNTTLKLVVYPAVAIFSLAAAFVAHAQTNNFELPQAQAGVSTTTRAEVRAELLQSRANGTQIAADERYDPLAFVKAAARASQPRAQRRGVAPATRQDAQAAALIGEDSGSFYFAAQRAPRRSDAMLADSGVPSVR